MADTLTLALDGQVSLTTFTDAVAGLNALVAALAQDEGVAAGEIEWMVESLETSSAIATIRGVGSPEPIDRVVHAYEVAGKAIRDNDLAQLSARTRKASTPFLQLVQGGAVPSIRFETERRDVVIRPTDHLRLVRDTAVAKEPVSTALGAVTGRIQTLTDRGGLRFTLFDQLHDKAVSCYLRRGHENVMRNAWGHRAEVIGEVSRDPESGRPLSVRNVTAVQLLEEGSPDAWRAAMGIAPARTAMSAEDAIRLVRDAW